MMGSFVSKIIKEHGIMVLHRSPKSQNAGSIPAALEKWEKIWINW